MGKFYVIDGSSLVHRDYFASIPEEMKYARTVEDKNAEAERLLPKNSNGLFVNAVDGVLASVAGIIAYQKPDAIAICFDASRSETFRRQMFPDYKAQRGETERALSEQMRTCETVLREMGFAVFSDPYYEADDFAGSIAERFASAGEEIHLVTTDRDYFQLVNDNATCHLMVQRAKWERLVEENGPSYGPLGTYAYNAALVKKEVGVEPSQITDWKGISGDSSDNIPGVKGVSDKSAVPLLNRYGSLEGIYEYLGGVTDEEAKAEWKGLGITRPPVSLMREGEESARFCKDLATIKKDVEVFPRLKDYALRLKPRDFKAVAEQFELEGLEEFLERFEDLDSWELPKYEERTGENVHDGEKEREAEEAGGAEEIEDFDIYG